MLKRAEEVSKVLRGNFDSCGKLVGIVDNLRDIYCCLGHEESDPEECEICADEDEQQEQEDSEDTEYSVTHLGKALRSVADKDSERHYLTGIDVSTLEERYKTVKVADVEVKIDDDKTFREKVFLWGSVSGFGDVLNQRNLVDKEVRDAREFREFRWGNDNDDLMNGIPEVRKAVESIVPEHLRHSIKLVPYKLNLYGKGGRFREHTDHPVDATHTIGSLVIVFPTGYKGGDLALDRTTRYGNPYYTSLHDRMGYNYDKYRSHGHEVDYEHQKSVRASKLLGVAAFLSIVPHEVLEVTSGCRVSLTYTIDVEYDAAQSGGGVLPSSFVVSSSGQPSTEEKRANKRIQNAYKCIVKGNEPSGILLRGEYTLEAVASAGIRCIVEPSDVALLKAIHKHLGPDTRLQVISVACKFESPLTYGLDSYDRNDDLRACKCNVFQISLDRFEKVFGYCNSSSNNNSISFENNQQEEFIVDTDRSEYERIRFYVEMNTYKPPGILTKYEQRNPVAFTGNESQEGSLNCVYFAAAIVFLDTLNRPPPPPRAPAPAATATATTRKTLKRVNSVYRSNKDNDSEEEELQHDSKRQRTTTTKT